MKAIFLGDTVIDVFITIDTEYWPRGAVSRESFEAGYRRDILGETPAGSFGVPYQLDVFAAHNLKAVFFVEALSPEVLGTDLLRDVVEMVQARGHEVQLHLHTEWLKWMTDPPVVAGGPNIKDYTAAQQEILIARGLHHLRAVGARDVCAFRAGNYGANFDTLRALARNGIRYDTSHNTMYLGAPCDMATPSPLLQPAELHGVIEFPIAYAQDRLGRNRHAQLVAMSAGELQSALIQASRQGWGAFVIVSHSFELLRNRKTAGAVPKPDRFVIRRFEALCKFLDRNRDQFRTSGFADLPADYAPRNVPSNAALRSGYSTTAARLVSQFMRRVIG